MRYKKGQRVVCIEDWDWLEVHDTGTVLSEVGEHEHWIPVGWDKESDDLHDCNGLCEDGHGWFVVDNVIIPYISPIDISELI